MTFFKLNCLWSHCATVIDLTPLEFRRDHFTHAQVLLHVCGCHQRLSPELLLTRWSALDPRRKTRSALTWIANFLFFSFFRREEGGGGSKAGLLLVHPNHFSSDVWERANLDAASAGGGSLGQTSELEVNLPLSPPAICITRSLQDVHADNKEQRLSIVSRHRWDAPTQHLHTLTCANVILLHSILQLPTSLSLSLHLTSAAQHLSIMCMAGRPFPPSSPSPHCLTPTLPLPSFHPTTPSHHFLPPPSLPDNTTAGHPIIFTRAHLCAAVHPALCWQGMPGRCERARARQDVLLLLSFFFYYYDYSIGNRDCWGR